MRTVGDYYNEIEQAKKIVHDLQIINNDFPKGCYVHETIKTASNIVKKYQLLLMEKNVGE